MDVRREILANGLRSLRTLDRSDHIFYRRNLFGSRVAEDTAAVHEDLQFVVSEPHLRTDAVLRNQLALKAPGQASYSTSNQAAVDFNLSVPIHAYFFSTMSTLARVSAHSSFKTAVVLPV